MEVKLLVDDYYGAKFLLEADPDKELVIFIVDDNPIFLSFLKNLLKKPNRKIYTFKIGEDCIESLNLKPDLVILDYHLDGVNPGVMKGNQVEEIIREKSPDTEVVIVSSDEKFKLLSDLHLSQSKNIMFKDKETVENLDNKAGGLVEKKKAALELKKSHKVAILWTGVVLLVVTLIVILLVNYYG